MGKFFRLHVHRRLSEHLEHVERMPARILCIAGLHLNLAVAVLGGCRLLDCVIQCLRTVSNSTGVQVPSEGMRLVGPSFTKTTTLVLPA